MFWQLDDDDWREAFGSAGEEVIYGAPEASVNPVPGSRATSAPFRRADVTLLLGLATGEPDGADWVCAGRLNDGRWFCLRAGCAYSGWDVSSIGHASVALSLADLLRLGMDAKERSRCGLNVNLAMLEGADDEYVEREIVALVLGR